MHRPNANPFLFAFKFSAIPFHVYFSVKSCGRFHALKDVVCLAESIDVVKMLRLVFLQVRKKLVEADLSQ